jgi:thioredoxin reductase
VGKDVTIVEKRADLGMVQDINTFYVQPWVVSEVQRKGIKVVTGMAAKEFRGNELIIDMAGSMPPFYDDYPFNAPIKEQRLNADTVILALGRLPVNDLVKDLKGQVKEFYQVGDCIGTDPKWAFSAIRQGSMVGMLL